MKYGSCQVTGHALWWSLHQTRKLTKCTTMKQIPPPTEKQLEHFEEIERILDVTYGPRELQPSGDAIAQLVGTILSQNTSDVNTRRTFERLRETFATWEDVIEADTDDVRDAIQLGGLANIKAPRIQQALASIINRTGSLDLAFLEDMPPEQAQAWLTELDGIGPKTAACVMLFSLGIPVMPVDTHVGRVTTRLGVVPDRTSTITKERILEKLIGPDPYRMYAFHVETIAHGRSVCRARNPKCEECPLNHLCDYYRKVTS